MPADASEAGNASVLNCGLCRERGTVRTSTNCVTPWAESNSMNSSIGRVECPIVNTLHATSSASADVAELMMFVDAFIDSHVLGAQKE